MSDEFRAGASSVDISPRHPQLLRVRGLNHSWPTADILEGHELMADAVAVEVGGRRAVFATYDAMSHRAQRERSIREAVADQTGVEPMCVFAGARHNHSSGADPSDEDDPACVEAVETYAQRVVDGVTTACVQAIEALRPAEMTAGTAALNEPVGLNRRARFSYGGVMPRWGAGAIGLPGEKFAPTAGPDSTRIDFLAVRELGQDDPFAMLTAYATHIHLAAIPYFNSELVGGVKHALRDHFPGLVVSYANSTGGDLDIHGVHPMPADGLEARMTWYTDSCRLLGQRFADAVVATMSGARYSRPPGLHQAAVTSESRSGESRPRGYLINAASFGGLGIVTIPGEVFIEYIDRIRNESPFPHTLVVGFNGSAAPRGYTGTPLGYEQGGYETGAGPAPSPRDAPDAEQDDGRPTTVVRAGLETGNEIVADALALLASVNA
ncbi:MAG: hypothetical protein WD009_11965 [Phycisphaeraceae bacterium]